MPLKGKPGESGSGADDGLMRRIVEYVVAGAEMAELMSVRNRRRGTSDGDVPTRCIANIGWKSLRAREENRGSQPFKMIVRWNKSFLQPQ